MYKIVSLVEAGVVDNPCMDTRLKELLTQKLDLLFVTDLALEERVTSLARLFNVSKLSFEQFMTELFIPRLKKIVLETKAPSSNKAAKNKKAKRAVLERKAAYEKKLGIYLHSVLSVFNLTNPAKPYLSKGAFGDLINLSDDIVEKKRTVSIFGVIDKDKRNLNLCFFDIALGCVYKLTHSDRYGDRGFEFIQFLIARVITPFFTINQPVPNHQYLAKSLLDKIRGYLIERESDEKLSDKELVILINSCNLSFRYFKEKPIILFDVAFNIFSFFMPVVSTYTQRDVMSSKDSVINYLFSKFVDSLLPIVSCLKANINFSVLSCSSSYEGEAMKSYINMVVMFFSCGHLLEKLDSGNKVKFKELLVVLLQLSSVFNEQNSSMLKRLFIEKLSCTSVSYFGMFPLKTLCKPGDPIFVSSSGTFIYFLETLLHLQNGDAEGFLGEIEHIKCEKAIKSMFKGLGLLSQLEKDIFSYLLHRKDECLDFFMEYCALDSSSKLIQEFLTLEAYSTFMLNHNVYRCFESFLRLLFNSNTLKLTKVNVVRNDFFSFEIEEAFSFEIHKNTLEDMMKLDYFRTGALLYIVHGQWDRVLSSLLDPEGVAPASFREEVFAIDALFQPYIGRLFEESFYEGIKDNISRLLKKPPPKEDVSKGDVTVPALVSADVPASASPKTVDEPKPVDEYTYVKSPDKKIKSRKLKEVEGGAVSGCASKPVVTESRDEPKPDIKLNSRNQRLEAVVKSLNEQGVTAILEKSSGRHQKIIVVEGSSKPFPVPVHAGPLSKGLIQALEKHVNRYK